MSDSDKDCSLKYMYIHMDHVHIACHIGTANISSFAALLDAALTKKAWAKDYVQGGLKHWGNSSE